MVEAGPSEVCGGADECCSSDAVATPATARIARTAAAAIVARLAPAYAPRPGSRKWMGPASRGAWAACISLKTAGDCGVFRGRSIG